MKIAVLTLLVAAAAGSAVTRYLPGLGQGCCSSDACEADAHAPAVDASGEASGRLAGEYLDLRTATVYGGACHVNSEVASQGREALLAWRIDTGELAGVTLAAAVQGPENLARGGSRRSVLYVDAPDSARSIAAARWVQEAHGEALGEVVAVHETEVRFARDGDGFELEVAGVAAASGSLMADRACCTMPEHRWYDALGATLSESLVGFTDSSRFQGSDGLPAWRYDGANTAILGGFSEQLACGAGLTASGCCGVPAN